MPQWACVVVCEDASKGMVASARGCFGECFVYVTRAIEFAG
jgi:hypothetical protein